MRCISLTEQYIEIRAIIMMVELYYLLTSCEGRGTLHYLDVVTTVG